MKALCGKYFKESSMFSLCNYNNILLFKINVECIQVFFLFKQGTKEGIGTKF